MLEWLPSATRLYGVRAEDVRKTLGAAVRWLAAFHASTEEAMMDADQDHLPVYDADFYKGWLLRTKAFCEPLVSDHPWLPDVLNAVAPRIADLAQAPKCIVHGEFYPANILVHNGEIVPVDWQSLAIGPCEIDLASLLEGWEESHMYEELKEEYCRARWPLGSPEGFMIRLMCARLYWPLRWLGDTPQGALRPRRQGYVQMLKATADALARYAADGAGYR